MKHSNEKVQEEKQEHSNEKVQDKKQESITIYDFSCRKINKSKFGNMAPTNINNDVVTTAAVESDHLYVMEELGREMDNAHKWLKPRSHPALQAFQGLIFEDLVGQVRDVGEVDNWDIHMDLAERIVDVIIEKAEEYKKMKGHIKPHRLIPTSYEKKMIEIIASLPKF